MPVTKQQNDPHAPVLAQLIVGVALKP